MFTSLRTHDDTPGVMMVMFQVGANCGQPSIPGHRHEPGRVWAVWCRPHQLQADDGRRQALGAGVVPGAAGESVGGQTFSGAVPLHLRHCHSR